MCEQCIPINPNSLSIVTEQYKSFKNLQLPLSRELGLLKLNLVRFKI